MHPSEAWGSRAVGRYFFHVCDRSGCAEDEEGRVLPSMEKVLTEALKGARSIMADDVCNGFIDFGARIEVCDESGSLVLTLPFDEAVELKMGDPLPPETPEGTERP